MELVKLIEIPRPSYYTIVSASLIKMPSVIQDMLKSGWIPLGAPFFDTVNPNNLLQAVIKYT